MTKANTAIDELLAIASHASAESTPLNAKIPDDSRARGVELLELLRRRNGFYAFESALQVYGIGSQPPEIDLLAWNTDDTWRAHYRGLPRDHMFFAQDIFGGQFSIHRNAITQFDPETGESEFFAGNLNEWAQRILDDYPVLTGHPVAHDWQAEHRPLPTGQRLVPKRPFVLGGEYEIDNLFAMDAAKSLKMRGDTAEQLRALPDGASVIYRVVD